MIFCVDDDSAIRDIEVYTLQQTGFKAKGSEMDKIYGLDLGSDDYLVKPFSVMEMVSRVKAVLRRCNKSNNQEEKTIQDGCLVLNKEEYSVFINQEKINLTIKEFSLLEILLSTKSF